MSTLSPTDIRSFAAPLAQLDHAARQLCTYVCPLFVLKRRAQPVLIGSGVPLMIGRASVIVTAAHVLEPYGGVTVLTLGADRAIVLTGERRGFGRVPGRHVDVDLAVIVLAPSEKHLLQERYGFTFSLHFDQTGSVKDVNFFAIVGYPQSKNKLSPRLKNRGAVVATYFISRAHLPIEKIASDDKFAGTHFAIGAKKAGAVGLTGVSAGFPAPQGLSGGGVWRFHFPRQPGLLPVCRLVGIGIEYVRTPGAFVCTRIEHVERMVEDLC